MPPGEKKLSAREKGDAHRLDRRGREKAAHPEPASAPPGPVFTEEDAGGFWSFQPIRRPEVPEVGDPGLGPDPDSMPSSWPPSRPRGATFSPEADRRTLIRRASFDLLGLPPTPEDVEAFAVDKAPDAYDRPIYRLLDSRHDG